MRALTEAEYKDLQSEVTALIWRHAAALADVEPAPADETLSGDTARPASLATVAVAEAVTAAVDSVSRSAARWAAEHGADYGDLGQAAGITRQGARRRWPGLAEVTAAARARTAEQARKGG